MLYNLRHILLVPLWSQNLSLDKICSNLRNFLCNEMKEDDIDYQSSHA